MYARKHQLTDTGFGKPLCLGDNILLGPGPYPSPDIGDDAVAAELIAAVLYLHKCPGMSAYGGYAKAAFVSGLCLISHKSFRRKLRDPFLILIFHEDIHGAVGKEGLHAFIFKGSIHIAACCYYKRFGIPFSCPVQHLPGFFIRHIRDGTCIYDIYIRFIRKIPPLKAKLFQAFADGIRFIGIDLASKGMYGIGMVHLMYFSLCNINRIFVRLMLTLTTHMVKFSQIKLV